MTFRCVRSWSGKAARRQGGKIKVPRLRIEENGQSCWLSESKTTIADLNERFARA
jgi:hypothetical protein